MKSERNDVKNCIIINYCKYIKTNKDPIIVAEEIALKLYSLIDKCCLNKYSDNLLTPNILQISANSDLFNYIKESVCELQVTLFLIRILT